MTSQELELLRSELQAIGAALDDSERKVERALAAGTLAAIIGAIAIVLGTVFSLVG